MEQSYPQMYTQMCIFRSILCCGYALNKHYVCNYATIKQTSINYGIFIVFRCFRIGDKQGTIRFLFIFYFLAWFIFQLLLFTLQACCIIIVALTIFMICKMKYFARKKEILIFVFLFFRFSRTRIADLKSSSQFWDLDTCW